MKKPYLSQFEENLLDDINSLYGKTMDESVADTDKDIIFIDFGATSTAIVEDTDYDNTLVKE
jgi:hypothetical protein